MKVGFWFNISAVRFDQLANLGISSRMEAEEWNRVLLQAVFSADRGSGSVRIIRATDSFLAAAVSEPASTGSVIRERFVDSLRSARRSARNFFDFDVQMRRWEAAPGPPPFFVQLYFSLLVASATEATHDEGDFRRRFCSMLGLPPGDYINRGLADLWRELERWTQEQNRAGRPIRPLTLPEPGFEKIIGYSKRLAFPGFSDFGRLANTLHEAELSSDSPLHAVLACIGRRLPSFSSQFNEEYIRLRALADRSPQSLYMEPLWAAIEAASFEPSDTSRRSRPRFALELSIDHFGAVNAHLFTNRHPHATTGRSWRVVDASGARDGFAFSLVPANDSSVLESMLSGDSGVLRILSRSPIGKLLEQGCLVFAPSDEAPWSWRPSLPPAGPVGIVCQDEPLALLKRVLHGAQPRTTRLSESPRWTLLEISDCTPIARSTALLDGLDRFDSLCVGVARQQLVLIRPIRLPDGILINRACRADILAIDCDRVTVEDAGSSELHIAQDLEPCDDVYMFRLPATLESELHLPARLVFTGWSSATAIIRRTIIASPSVIDSPLTDDYDATSYLIESSLGQLVGTATDTTQPMTQEVDGSCTGIEPMIPVIPSNHVDDGEISQDPIEKWDDVEEALYGAFLSAKALSADRISELTRIVMPGWLRDSSVATTLLWHGSRVARRWARRWYGSSYFPVVPHLRLNPKTNRLQLAGMTCRRIRDRFASLHARAVRPNRFEGLGPAPSWYVDCLDADEAKAIALRMGLRLRVSKPSALPSPTEVLGLMTPRYRADLATQVILYWNSNTRRFDETHDPSRPIELRMSVLERGQRIYSLLRAGQLLWATESRAWAGLIHRVLTAEPAFSRTADRIVAKQPLPVVIAEAAGSGEGVTVRATDSGLEWAYRFGDQAILDEFLSAWTARPAFDRSALIRWASARKTEQMDARSRALVRRYGSTSLRESTAGGPR